MKSIIFNDEMVRAVLSGQKTVTRRPIMKICKDGPIWRSFGGNASTPSVKIKRKGKSVFAPAKQPFKVGEVVYMRECFAQHPVLPEFNIFRATFALDAKSIYPGMKWTPSIHMGEDDSRVKMRITECYAEKLNDIPIVDYKKEGAELPVDFHEKYTYDEDKTHLDLLEGFAVELRKSFIKLWNSCYEDPYDWASNPYVWVIRFEVVNDE